MCSGLKMEQRECGLLECDVEDQTDVLNCRARKILEHRNQVKQFIIVSIREPTADRYSMLGVEDVGGRRVIDDDGVLQVPSDLRKVFDIIALVVVTTFAEQPVVDDIVNIQLIK